MATCSHLLAAGLNCLKCTLPKYPLLCRFSRSCREGKEFCEHFAEIFTVMDPRDFADVFSVRMGVLYDAMCADPDALTVAAHLVQSSSVGRTFNALLAEYLTKHKLQLLADPSHKVRACLCIIVCFTICRRQRFGLLVFRHIGSPLKSSNNSSMHNYLTKRSTCVDIACEHHACSHFMVHTILHLPDSLD